MVSSERNPLVNIGAFCLIFAQIFNPNVNTLKFIRITIDLNTKVLLSPSSLIVIVMLAACEFFLCLSLKHSLPTAFYLRMLALLAHLVNGMLLY